MVHHRPVSIAMLQKLPEANLKFDHLCFLMFLYLQAVHIFNYSLIISLDNYHPVFRIIHL